MCFLLLAVVSHAAVNMGERHISSGSYFVLGKHLGVELQVMSNLDSIFKSRDITLPTKVRLVKAMVFPVVMYGCESWTVEKAEH